jgi:hypothetical protein
MAVKQWRSTNGGQTAAAKQSAVIMRQSAVKSRRSNHGGQTSAVKQRRMAVKRQRAAHLSAVASTS